MELPKQVLTSTDWPLQPSCGFVKRIYPMSKTVSKTQIASMWNKRKVQNIFLANINILFVAVRLTSKNYKWQILSYIKALNQPNCWTPHMLYQPFANVYDQADCFLPWFSLNWTWFKWLHRVQMCSGTALICFSHPCF